jgi:putative two-component system response regulator
MALRYFQEVLISIRQQRQAQLHALISLDLHVIGRRNDEVADLRALAYTEASLRAEAAELELENAHHEMLERLAVTASLKEDPSGSHGYRVGALCSALAAEMEWSRKDRYEIEIAGRLHDIGKVAIPDSITLGTRFLDQAERELMRSHCIVGYELLSNSSARGIQLAAQVARCHHEWWNGSGYPAGLQGERIPLASRIVALADVFDAMTHGRRYSAALPIEMAHDEIASLGGKQFDPRLVPVFTSLVRKLVREHTDLDRYLAAAASTSPFFTARKRISALLGAESRPVAVA